MSETYNELDLSFCGPLVPPKLSLEQKLGLDLAWLVRNAPTADHTKAALRVANVCFPSDTADLVAWLEENWNPPAPTRAPQPPRNRDIIRLTGTYSAEEYGRVSYTQRVTGSVSVRITLAELREMAESSTSRADLMSDLETYLDNNGDCEAVDHGDIEYRDTDCDGEENREIDSYDFQEEVNDWLDANPDVDPDHEEEEDTDSDSNEDDEEEENEEEESN